MFVRPGHREISIFLFFRYAKGCFYHKKGPKCSFETTKQTIVLSLDKIDVPVDNMFGFDTIISFLSQLLDSNLQKHHIRGCSEMTSLF